MRHLKKRHKIARGSSHRKATLAAMASALIEHKKITTTIAKAKALRVFIEPLLNRAKDDTMHNRRQVFRRLKDKRAVSEAFDEVGPMLADRPGGYTRIVKLGQRAGDSAEMAIIELVDYNDVKPDGASGSRRTRRTRRSSSRRRSGGQGAAKPAAAPAPAPVEDATPAGDVEDAVVVEETTADAPAPAESEAPTESEATDSDQEKKDSNA